MLLVARIRLPPHGATRPRRPAACGTTSPRGSAGRAHHAAVRTLALTILIFNVTFGAAWSVLVLYAQQRLGLGAVGFGLLTTVSAAGGLLGTGLYGWITRRVSLGNVMRVGLIIETLTHLGARRDHLPVGRLGDLLRLRRPRLHLGHHLDHGPAAGGPDRLQGRVGSVNTISVFGGLVVGSVIGGVLATRYGVTAPFWFAFAGSAVFVVLLWRELTRIAHSDDPAPVPAASGLP